jgi:Luciferase-like monooxygenase
MDGRMPRWGDVAARPEWRRKWASTRCGFPTIWALRTPLTDGTAGGRRGRCSPALAGVTSRVRLGTYVPAVPLRNPAVLAKMAETFDEVSGGRLILGLGAGWNEPEFRAFGSDVLPSPI